MRRDGRGTCEVSHLQLSAPRRLTRYIVLDRQLDELRVSSASNFAQVHSHLVTVQGGLDTFLAEGDGTSEVEDARYRLARVISQVARLRDELEGGDLGLPLWVRERGRSPTPEPTRGERSEGRRGGQSPRKRGRSPVEGEAGPSSRARKE